MKKINFVNNQAPALNDTNLNALQQNVEDVFNGTDYANNMIVESIRSKNMLLNQAVSKTQNGITWTINNDGTITATGTATAYTSLFIGQVEINSSMGNIVLSGLSNTTNIGWTEVSIYDSSNNALVSYIGEGSKNNQVIDLSNYSTAKYIKVSVKRINNVATSGTIKPQLEKGNTATDYAPYQNLNLDYGEGTWTPSLGALNETAPTTTYTIQTGYYKKVGKIVFITFYVRAKITALNGTNNYATIEGLPYTAISISIGGNTINLGISYSALSDETNNSLIVSGNRIRIQRNYGTSTTTWKITSTSYMEIGGSGFYFVD